MKRARAFTLVEIIIVVALLGILAAVAIPGFVNCTTPAKESALGTDLKTLRRVILLYKNQHMEIGPGYPNGQTSANPTEQAFVDQVTLSSTIGGQTAAIGTAGFDRGPYVQRIPENPFNGKNSIQMLANGEPFPANADNSHGWIYKAATVEIRGDNTGTNADGKKYYDY